MSLNRIKIIITSVTRSGDFWNFLGTNFVTKVAQKFNAMWDNLNNVIIKLKPLGYFLSNCGENFGLLFISTSSHTDFNSVSTAVFWLSLDRGVLGSTPFATTRKDQTM